MQITIFSTHDPWVRNTPLPVIPRERAKAPPSCHPEGGSASDRVEGSPLPLLPLSGRGELCKSQVRLGYYTHQAYNEPMIRRDITPELLECADEYPVVTILGPRQSGKTTLARMTFPDRPYVSMEDPDMRAVAGADPRGFLSRTEKGVILDEVQRLPILLSYIQTMVDESREPGRFILTGSHQPQLHEAISQSLAGRTAVLTLWPFSLPELRHYQSTWETFELIVRGFFPGLHEQGLKPRRFFNSYLQTYVERDVRALIRLRDHSRFETFLTLLGSRVGQLVNFTSLSDDVGVSGTTIKNWLSVLKASYVIFELQPYFANIRKRVVKSSKIYFTDVGLVAFLLGIRSREQAFRDPLRGNLYENLVIAEIIKGAFNRGIRPELYFYRDSHGNEVDLLVRDKGRIIPVEIKSASTFSPHFIKTLEALPGIIPHRLEPGYVLFNGERVVTIREIQALNPLDQENLWDLLTGARP